MNQDELVRSWLAEEQAARIQGWDFSHIRDRYEEEDMLPWDFKSVIQKYLTDDMKLLDMETGGGEFLLSLKHPVKHTSAIEGFQPNVDYCRRVLLPLGIDFKEADGAQTLPFQENSFDVVTNRHGDYLVPELRRVLKKNGIFLTQQVGAENDRELVELLLPDYKTIPYPEQYLAIRKQELIQQGFAILEDGETFQPIRFSDVGALVWFAKIIEWEFPGFTVSSRIEQLLQAQEMIERKGVIEGQIHRFYLVAQNLKSERISD